MTHFNQDRDHGAPFFYAWKFRSFEESAQKGPPLWSIFSDVDRPEATYNMADTIIGYSVAAGKMVDFTLQRAGDGSVNWRESVVCPVTGLNNRMRAAHHLFEFECKPDQQTQIYITEQTTPFYAFMKSRFPNTVGSEFMTDTPNGAENADGVRSEDLTKLTFPDQSFDCILSFDVLEHVPDFKRALAECHRVLKDDGRAYITVPFTFGAETLVRAKIDEGGDIIHILEPEYHGDPISNGGILCFYHFGWSFIEDLKQAGFSDAYAAVYWDPGFGYLGVMQSIIVAVK